MKHLTWGAIGNQSNAFNLDWDLTCWSIFGVGWDRNCFLLYILCFTIVYWKKGFRTTF